MSNSENLLLITIPVIDVLSWFGKRVDHRGYMYYSPFRDEDAPSMRVTVNPSDGTWMWADFGGSPSAGKKADGGGCLEMVRRLGGFATNEAAFEELRRIAEARGVNIIRQETRASKKKAVAKPSGLEIVRIEDRFNRRRLMEYSATKRGIPVALLQRYCKQVTYRTASNTSREFFAIGFPNDGGGFALRGSGDPKKSKHNYLSGVSTFGPDGRHVPRETVFGAKCAVFEGFMDFLSYLAWRGVDVPGIDVCVLNSTSNISWAKDWILSHDAVRTFFDNDRSGTEATEAVQSWCLEAGKDYKDGRGAYETHNDINEAWVEELSRRRARSEKKDRGRGIK